MDGTVVLGLAGIGATLIVGLAGTGAVMLVATWQRRDAQRHRFTDTKRGAYVDFLSAVHEADDALKAARANDHDGSSPLAVDWSARLSRAGSGAMLLAPRGVLVRLAGVLDTFQVVIVAANLSDPEWESAREAYQSARGAFFDAVRKDLAVSY